MRGLQGTPEKAAIMRFGALSMWMGVAGIWVVPSGLDPSGGQRRKTGGRSVAIVVRFYVPRAFQKRLTWTPPHKRGKVIEFHPPQKAIRLKDFYPLASRSQP